MYYYLSAFWLGYDDFWYWFYDNPYPIFSYRWFEYEDGWDEAEADWLYG